MAVFGYVRVSTERQADEGVSLDEQKRRIEGRAVEEGWQFAEVYVERGVSGATPFVERLKGRQLDARLRKGDILVAAKLDRMFRSALDALNVIEDFQRRGVSLWLLDLGGDVSGNGIAKLMMTMLSAFAEFERNRISERIRDAKRHLKRNGQYLGGVRPFGWRVGANGELEPEPDEQSALTRIRELRAAGKSLRRIAAELTAAGTPISHELVRRALAAG